MASNPRIVSIAGTTSAVILADLIEAPLEARLDSANAAEVDVRDPQLLDIAKFEQAKHRFESLLTWNETTLAPRSLTHSNISGRSVTHVRLAPSSYAAFRAAREQIIELDEKTRVDLITREGLGTPASFSHTFGVNCTLETSDGMLILVRRGAANESTAGQLSIAMSENSNIEDTVENDFDPLDTAVRGFDEELGLSPDDLGSPGLGFAPVTFNAIIAQVPDCAISVLGHAITQLTSDEVVSRQKSARDQHESAGIELCEFTPGAIESLLTSQIEWTPWTPAALIGALRVRFGAEITESVLERVGAATPVAPA